MISQLISFLLLLTGIFHFCASFPVELSSHDFKPDTWDDVPVSTDNIHWWRCPNEYQEYSQIRCMRLKVPLDYEDPQAGTTTITFMKHFVDNATATTPDVLYNPGGPGASGIENVLFGKDRFRKFMGTSYNIIAFDPRGIGHSGPNMDCFDGDEVAAYQYVSAMYPASLNATFVSSGTWGDLCKKNLDASARFLGTPAVARDMLTYAERYAATQGFDPAEANVNFYGLRYGTVLGATFATLYPNRVGRFVLDSVMQGKPYYKGGARFAFADQDAAIGQLFRQCSEAGPKRCKFWAGSAEQTEARYERLLQSLGDNPLDIPYNEVAVDAPIQITADVVRYAVMKASYHGHSEFRQLAKYLTKLERGDYQSWLDIEAVPAPSCTNCSLADWRTLFETFPNPLDNSFSTNALGGIMCTDLVPQDIPTLEAFEDFMAASWKSSRYAGMVGTLAAPCRKWPFRPPPSQQFDGNFGANTSHPMLILTNTFDPICAAVYARQMIPQFPGSVLLEEEAVGHGATSLGACIDSYVKDYFETGKLPPPDTICMPDKKPSLHAKS